MDVILTKGLQRKFYAKQKLGDEFAAIGMTIPYN